MNVRFGLMIIGPTLTGKSEIIRTLEGSMNYLMSNGYEGEAYSKVRSRFLNPKSISMAELYGNFSAMT